MCYLASILIGNFLHPAADGSHGLNTESLRARRPWTRWSWRWSSEFLGWSGVCQFSAWTNNTPIYTHSWRHPPKLSIRLDNWGRGSVDMQDAWMPRSQRTGESGHAKTTQRSETMNHPTTHVTTSIRNNSLTDGTGKLVTEAILGLSPAGALKRVQICSWQICRTRRGFSPSFSTHKKTACRRFVYWRRERDSNPRYVAVYTLSRRAPSATRTSLLKSLLLYKFGEKSGVYIA